MSGPFDYRAFGLRLRSEIELPELFADPFDDDPDVTVSLGEVAAHADPSVAFSADDQGARLLIAGVARYRVSSGSRIMVDPEQGAPAANVRLFLLGSAMGLLLHQRGLLPLHANAVEIGGKAFAFMGQSGAGKSTLAAAFHDRGYRIIADDVCVVHVEEAGWPMVSPGLPRLRLWRDAIEATGRDPNNFERSFAGRGGIEKFDVPLAKEKTISRAVRLAAIYLLERGEKFEIEQLHGVTAAEAVIANIYRGKFTRFLNNPVAYWSISTRLAGNLPIFLAKRPWGFEYSAVHADGLLDHVRGLPETSGAADKPKD